MNGADALIHTLADAGVAVCFANPGTSEMQLVTALDREPRMRPVLCLFEGVATGAADGYGRMAGKPACTMLHLGPGLGNGLANLHNARRARTPIINIVGDHASYHLPLDAPLTSDIAAIAGACSGWVRSIPSAAEAGVLAAQSVRAALAGQGATLVLPADSAWDEGAAVAEPLPVLERPAHTDAALDAVVAAVRVARKPAVLMNGSTLCDAGLAAASRLAAAGVAVFTDTFVARLPRGAGRFAPTRLPYFGEQAAEALAGTDVLVLVEATAPVAFFAYPGKPGVLTPDGATVHTLVDIGGDGVAALTAWADAMGAVNTAPVPDFAPPAISPKWNAATVGQVLCKVMPEGSIVSDDAVTAGLPCFSTTATARAHDWLMLTGGAIGQGLPLAVGAAAACPDRQVIALTGDGAGMYTVQSLWTMAREGQKVVTIVFANHAYRILTIELGRTGAGDPGHAAKELLEIGNPRIDWVAVSTGLGVPAARVADAVALEAELLKAFAADGPYLIEVAL
jgi:acetolactate synthase-1/2/3 large subunit